MNRSPLSVAFALFAASLAAQDANGVVVVPPAAAGVEQAGSGPGPWGSGTASTRTLVVHDAASFTALGISGPFTIRGIRWRANGGGGGNSGTFTSVQVSVSTAATDYLALSTTFAANHGGDLTLVHNGSVAVASPVAAQPSSFPVQVPFTTPFVYDPASGDLAIDVQCDGTGWIGAVGPAFDRAQGTGAGSMLTAPGATQLTGAITANQAPVIELLTDLPMAAPTLVINEFVYDSTTPSREFVELYNASAGSINLASWTLRATTSAGTTTLATLPSVVLAPGQYYVIGNAVGVPPVLTSDLALAAVLPNGTTTLHLRNPADIVIDAVEYGDHAGGVPVFQGEGQPLFGAHRLDPVSPTSWSRHRDGHDTGRNGLDFRIAPWTPKASNNLPSLLPYTANFDALGIGTAVPSWAGSAAPPVAVDPTALSTFNPKVVPFSPQGGRCASFAMPGDVAGGRSFLLLTDATSQIGFRAQVYFDATLAPPGQSYAWSIGVGGTTDSDYAMPFPVGPIASDQNGDTGVSWTYHVTSTSATLYLLGHGAGGVPHHVIKQHAVTTSGWRSLQLDLLGTRLIARYDGTQTQAHAALAAGGLYVGVRNQAPGALVAALRVDDMLLDDGSNTGIIIVGSSCDGNCPPKNKGAKAVDLDTPKDKNAPMPTGYYAIPVEPTFSETFSAVAVLSQLGLDDMGSTATVRVLAEDSSSTLKPKAPTASAVVPASLSLQDPDRESNEAGWWIATFPATSQVGRFFIEFHHDGSMELPIAAPSDDFGPEFSNTYYYRALPGDPWKLVQREIAWAYGFTCTSTSGNPHADIKGTYQIGTSSTSTLRGGFPVGLAIAYYAFASIPGGIDLGFLGAPGCSVHVDISAGFGLPAVTDALGNAQQPITLPNDPLSIGVAVHQQWFLLDPSANPFGWIVSNALSTVIH